MFNHAKTDIRRADRVTYARHLRIMEFCIVQLFHATRRDDVAIAQNQCDMKFQFAAARARSLRFYAYVNFSPTRTCVIHFMNFNTSTGKESERVMQRLPWTIIALTIGLTSWNIGDAIFVLVWQIIDQWLVLGTRLKVVSCIGDCDCMTNAYRRSIINQWRREMKTRRRAMGLRRSVFCFI